MATVVPNQATEAAADAEAKSDARLAALDESWAAQEATIQLLEARATARTQRITAHAHVLTAP